jgi:hypothetical protein
MKVGGRVTQEVTRGCIFGQRPGKCEAQHASQSCCCGREQASSKASKMVLS